MVVLRTRGLLHRVVRLALDLLRQVKLERFHLDAAFGFDDPAYTGVCYGMLSPLFVMADIRELDVHCRPMFVESGLRGDFHATVRVRPLSVMGTLIAFFLSRPVLLAIRSAWRKNT